MANQEKIEIVTEQIIDIIGRAKMELSEDLLKLKEKITDDEFIETMSKLNFKSLLDAKIQKAKQIFISHHKTILEETIPFGDVDASK